jgi:transcriptional regulator with XRE-family HTH domain
MSVDELANKINKNRATIYRYEKGDIGNLPLDILEPLANALETTPQYLMGWETPEVKEVKIVNENVEFIYRGSKKSVMNQVERWYEEFNPQSFTEEEYEKIMEYARFLIYIRENK